MSAGVSDRNQLRAECERIAAEARALLAGTRAKRVRALPGVEADRAELEAIADRAERLAERLHTERPAREGLARPRSSPRA
jgi:hypothetical protein